MLTTSITLHRKSKDGTSVTILSTSVQYQVSASPTDIPKTWYDDIKNAIQTDSKPYLWSKTTVEYSGNKTTITYSVSYKGKDGTNGTSFTPKGTATGFFYNMSSVPSYEDGMDSDVYIVNVDDRSNPTSELPPYVCHFEYENFIIEHAEFGDGYNVKGHLYVANSNEWVDFGEIQGAKGDPGDPGDPGKDAVNINLSPSELVYNADKDGNISSTQFNNNTSTVSATMGGKAVSCSTSIVSKDNCEASFISSNVIKITKITTESVGTGKYVPASAGGVKLKVTVDGTDYYSYLPFRVNINTFVKTVLETDESFQRKYTEISNKYNTISNELNGKASKDELREVSSSIEQTARRISLEVSSNAVGRRNMLVNSAFRNQDSVFIHSLAHIEKNTGVDGVNCIHSSDQYSGTGDGNYIGAFWNSTQKNGVVTNIPIRMGKKYVISCWIKSDNKALPFVIECFFMNSINQQNRPEDAVRKEYHVDNVNEWKRIDFVVDTTDTSEYASKVTPYLAVNIWSNTKNVPKATGATEYPTCHAYICKPMMEEGDTYGGWTLSEDDYEYVGGNILDNTRSLEKSGNLEKEESEIINEGYEYAYAVAHSNNTTSTHINMIQWNVAGRINDGQDYMFSFLAKGTGMVGTYLWKDGTPRFFVESSNNKHNDVSSDGNVYFELTKEWKRYWVHYHLNTSSGHPLPEKLLIRCYGGNEVYICQPKLEIGATMTEFTERKTDLVDKTTMKKAGIEITTNQIKLYGDKVQVLTRKDENSEYVEAGLFVNGKLNANLIDAGKIEVKHLWAKSEDGTNKVGYFGNYEIDACKVDDTTYAPLFVGGDTASQSPFYVSSEGAMYATSGYIGGFNIGNTSIDGINGSNKLMLTPGYISFDNKTHGINNIIGANWKYGLDYVGQQIVVKYDHPTPSYGGNIGIANLKNIALYVSASGNIDRLSRDTGVVNSVYPCGNHAIFCDKGDFAGFRPCFRIITSSQTLSKYDVFLEIVDRWKKHNSITGADTIVDVGEVTLSLPTKPEIGQMYWIIRSSKYDYTLKTTDGTKIFYPAGNGTSYKLTTDNEMACIIYTGTNWRLMWNMGI